MSLLPFLHIFKKCLACKIVSGLKKEKALLNISKWRLLKFQSPIKMYRKDCVSYDNFESLEFNGFWNTNAEGALTNNGSTGNFELFGYNYAA